MLSPEMILARNGNFTASENHRLMAGWKDPVPDRDFPEFAQMYPVMKKLWDEEGKREFLVGDLKPTLGAIVTGKTIAAVRAVLRYDEPPTGLVTYAEEKAMEELCDPDPSLNFSTIHTRNGEERELQCMQFLADETGLEFVHTGDNQVHIHNDGVGCTPDGVVYDEIDLVTTGAEVKCKSPLEHGRLLLVNNNDDLKNDHFDHYVQVQTQMLVTGADHWYFASFNPFGRKPQYKFKWVKIERDPDFIKILSARLELAKSIKAQFLANIEKAIDEARKPKKQIEATADIDADDSEASLDIEV